MNRKQFTLLLVLLVVLGLAGLVVYNKQNAGQKEADPSLGQKLLGDLPVNDVAQISLKQGTNQLNLVKKDNLWRVRERNDYPANYGEISGFLLKARDLKISQTERVGPSQLGRFGLVAGEGTNAALTLELKDQAGKNLQTVLLGKKHMRKSNRPSPFGDEMGDSGWPDGRYVKVGNSDRVVLISDALANIEPKPEQWLNKDFIKVEKVHSITVEFPAATNSWKLTRETETAEWKLADAKTDEQLDSTKTSGLATQLSSPSFNDLELDAKPEQWEKPTVVTIDTFDNFNYTLKVGQKTNDNYPLALTVAAQIPKERTPGNDEKPEDKTRLDKEFKDKQQKFEEKLAQEKAYEKWVYLVSSWTLEPLLKERAQLLQEKKEEPKTDQNVAPTAATTPPEPPSPLEPVLAPADSDAP